MKNFFVVKIYPNDGCFPYGMTEPKTVSIRARYLDAENKVRDLISALPPTPTAYSIEELLVSDQEYYRLQCLGVFE